MKNPRKKSKFKIAPHTRATDIRRWAARNSRRLAIALFFLIVASFSAVYNFPEMLGDIKRSVKVGGEPLSYSTMKNDLAKDRIERASLIKNEFDVWTSVVLTYKDERVEWLSIKDAPELAHLPELTLTNLFQASDVAVSTAKSSGETSLFMKFTGFLMTLGLISLVSLIMYVMCMQVSEVGGAAAGIASGRRKSTTRFCDVEGIDDAKTSLMELVDIIRNPGAYEIAGARTPRGVLLSGPPGTGKTLVAKAVAGETNAAFLSFSPNDFSSMYIGIGKLKVRAAFNAAREQAPAILFIDEIDTLARKRGQDHREYDAILNEILVQMDGFEGREGVIVIGATNRVDTMDPAILRPGRFDNIIPVGMPDADGRARILRVHTNDLPIAEGVDLEAIAQRATGCSGAMLENLANEAALSAARNKRNTITTADFDLALDKMTLGDRRKGLVLTDEDKALIAAHEAGHALCSVLQVECDPIDRVTIIPHGQALGAVVRRPERDQVFNSFAKIEAELTVLMAGRAAERISFGTDKVTNGASEDIKEATKLAMLMTCEWGMSEEFGLVSIPMDIKDARIQKAAKVIIDKAHARAVKMINENRAAFDNLVAELTRKETLRRADVMKIIRSEPAQLNKAA